MGGASHPRHGSMQFWPRKRAKHSLARIRTWSKNSNKVKLLGFIVYKAGMTHLQVLDNRPKSATKGENIIAPVTIIECPPLTIIGVSFYTSSIYGLRKSITILAEKLSPEIARTIQLPKKAIKKIEEVKDFVDLRLLAASSPKLTGIGTKKPKVLEIVLGGSKEEKLSYAKEKLGKEIKVSEVLEAGKQVDLHGISKGKGFQGTVKRFGVPIRQHKAEKTKRGIGTLGPWHPNRILYTVPQPGKMGYHLRTEYNKVIMKIGNETKDLNPSGGFKHYGLVKNDYLLVYGSVIGPVKRPVVLIESIRPDEKKPKEAPEITYLHRK